MEWNRSSPRIGAVPFDVSNHSITLWGSEVSDKYTLLTDGASNPKTAKLAAEFGFLPAILHLASGRQVSEALGRSVTVCPMAEANRCEAPCLDYSGRGGFDVRVRAARIRKTLLYFTDRSGFVATLRGDIGKLESRAAKRGLRPVVRLDGTSDIGLAAQFAAEFPNVMHYDYTKVTARARRWVRSHPSNYHLTYSLGAANLADSLELLAAGVSVAVPFAVRKGEALPSTFHGAPVIDGDTHDYRFTDPAGVIVGLRAKQGSVKRDADNGGGFLVAA